VKQQRHAAPKRLRSSIPVDCDSGQAPVGQAADLLAVTANMYYTTIHQVIHIQPTRACFALCIVHVLTNITCNKINVHKAHVEKALRVRVAVPCMCSPYMPVRTFCPRVLAILVLLVTLSFWIFAYSHLSGGAHAPLNMWVHGYL